MADICLFNKFGHCKFQTTCRRRHVGKICEKDQCNIQSCSERHPRECTYYRDFGRCKFGTYCSFRHRNSKDEKIKELESELKNLKSKLEKFEEELKIESKQIEFILDALDKKGSCDEQDNLNTQDNDIKEQEVEPIFKCDICEYKTSSTKGINIHKKRIHKEFKDNDPQNKSNKHKEENQKRGVESSTEENVRSLDEVSERTISLHPKFKCYLCIELLPTLSDLIKHHKCNHNGRPNKLICEDCDETCTHAAMLVSHKQTKHNIYICARCNTQFYGREKIDDHNEKKHSEL